MQKYVLEVLFTQLWSTAVYICNILWEANDFNQSEILERLNICILIVRYIFSANYSV